VPKTNASRIRPQLPPLSHLIPPALYGGQTAFPALSKIDEDLRNCQGASPSASLLERSKLTAYASLRERFDRTVAQALALKILNICMARYDLEFRRTYVLSRPLGLVVDPSNMCRLACPGCVHSVRSEALQLFDWPKGTLSEDRFLALLKLYGPYAIGVCLYSYGEPLLNLATPKLVRLAKNHLMSTSLSTSLSVQRFEPDAYVESGLDFMVLSIDGATQAVYERFRRHGDLELVLRNVRRLVDAKRELRKRTPVLSWNFLAFEHNAHEIPLAARMARQLGVNQFRVVNPFDIAWDDPEIRPAAVKGGVRRLDSWSGVNLWRNWFAIPDDLDTDTIARAFDLPWGEPTEGATPPATGHTCHWLYKNMVMDATGRIMPCCAAPGPNVDLEFATFDGTGDPFNSEKYRRARRFFSSGVPGSGLYCERCEWDQTAVSTGSLQIRQYFRAMDAAFFDRKSLRILSGW
jgi:MoaA/NifB/PqqE/SkfB family radical SAM enzyme